jgi:hypothetical protein
MSTSPPELRRPAIARRAHAALVVVVLAGLIGFIQWPALQRKLGLFDFGRWFLDSYAVLAASDAARAGIDVEKSNPLDIFQRPHSYSDWWFALADLGLDRSDNFVVGASWVLGFLLLAFCTLRPRTYPETALFAAMLLSPPMLLVIMRTNNDLVVFALLGIGALALRRENAWRWLLAVAAIAVATGLKFYPAVAAAVLVLLRPPRRMLVAAGVTAVTLAVVIVDVVPSLGRGLFTLPQALYTFGGPVFWRDIGWMGGKGPVLASMAVIGAAGLALAISGRTVGVADGTGGFERRMLFALGASVLIGCFLAGASYAYRWIFALWLAPWLWDEAREPAVPVARRRAARFALGLLLALLWSDGLFCLGLNIFVGPMMEGPRDRIQLLWRLVTQPFVWVLMAMLAGWLFDAARAAWRDLRAATAAA